MHHPIFITIMKNNDAIKKGIKSIRFKFSHNKLSTERKDSVNFFNSALRVFGL